MDLKNLMTNKKIALAVFILIACFFYSDKLVFGPYATVRLHDSFNSEFSRYVPMGKLFMEHGFYAWYPNASGGMPSHGYQYPPFYILNLLSTFVPSWLLYTAMTILLMALAGYGLYWFLMDFLGVDSRMAFAGGLYFALYMQGTIVHKFFMFVFPVFFMCSMGLGFRNNSLKVKSLSLLSLLVITAVSYPVLTLPFFCVMQVLVIIFLNYQQKLSTKEMLTKTFLVWTGYILFHAPVLYALYEIVPFVQRTYPSPVSLSIFALNFSKHIIDSIVHIVFKSNMSFFIVVLLPLLYYSCKLRKALFVVLIPVFLASLFKPPLPTFLHQTLFAKMDLSHMDLTLPFAITVFCIVGFQEFLSTKVPKVLYYISFYIGGAIVIIQLSILGLDFRNLNLNISSMNWIESMGLTSLKGSVFLLILSAYFARKFFYSKTAWARLKAPLITLSVLMFIVVILQFKVVRLMKEPVVYRKYFDSHSAFTELRDKQSRNPFRVALLYLPPMITQHSGLETVGIRAPIQHKYYKEYFKEIIRPRLKTKQQNDFFDNYWYQLSLIMDRGRAWHPSVEQREKNISTLLNIPLLLMINTKYIVSKFYNPSLAHISKEVVQSESDNITRNGLVSGLFRKLDSRLEGKIFGAPYFIYEIKDGFDRGYLVQNAIVLPSDRDVLSRLSEQSVEGLKNNVFFSRQNSNIPDDFSNGKINVSTDNTINVSYYSPDRIVFDGITSEPSILVVTNNYHPKWTATVNGKKVKVYRANHAFQAIFIEESGKFRAVFEYKESMLWITYSAVPLGMVLIAFCIFFNLKRNPRSSAARLEMRKKRSSF